jgi:5-formyltetrahydrofolate cyclo-ligase
MSAPNRGAYRKELRKHFRALRSQLTGDEQNRAAEAISKQLIALLELENTENVRLAAYLENNGEPSLTPFIEYCWQSKIPITLPVLHPFAKRNLLFQAYTSTSDMGLNRYKIMEPKLDCSAIALLPSIDVILMPLVAFDRQKQRLGMGGGYYDTTLAPLRFNVNRPRLIGIAHSNQCYDEGLPSQHWDIPLDHVVTPEFVL